MQASKSFALERTQLAWKRTALAQLLISAVSVKIALVTNNILAIYLAILFIVISVANYIYSGFFKKQKDSFLVLLMNSVGVFVLGILAITVIL